MNAADLLPQPGAALLVHDAAARIRAASHRASAEAASNSYWDMGWTAGVTNAIGGAAGDLAAVFSPALAEEFADWLDAVASANARHGIPLPSLAVQAASAFTHTPTGEGTPA
ncbi:MULTISPECIES: hypothetical protein [unclassified Streptomyces]|uniref:hypothetical protein n=1 Tax=unclassified Streptomyces TaxID=2593676 RepID=UPI00225ADACF|nr:MULTISPECIES: hypothetical protein [unclassified Streptomyces]MCX4405932.1 hypothetical protein [Streptomyces sp. NBC_01764]MCX5189544.1 hypothetical protein [Streptomyces sp. NBC_00268]